MKKTDFQTEFQRKTYENIKENNLINKGDRVLAAVSGGKDSVALFCFLLSLTRELDFTLCAYHLNHKLRGKDADLDEEFVKKLCKENEIPIISDEIDINEKRKEEKKGFEETARNERYNGLESAARRLSCNVIATAHTKSDAAETLLINVCRGTGLKGLASIPVKRDNIIRPLIRVTSEEVYEYLESIDRDFRVDKTNFSADYTRNKIRLEVIPVLRSVNPAFLDNAERVMLAAASAYRYISSAAQDVLRRVTVERGVYLASPLRRLAEREENDALLYETLSLIVKEGGESLCSERYAAMKSALFGGGKSEIEISAALTIVFSKDAIFFSGRNAQDYTLSIKNGVQTVTNPMCKISVTEHTSLSKTKNINKLNKIALINADNINGELFVRASRPDDEYKLRGMTKSVKKLLNEKRVLLPYREKFPIICDETGPVCLCGFEPADRVRANDTDKNITLIKAVFEHNIYGDKNG